MENQAIVSTGRVDGTGLRYVALRFAGAAHTVGTVLEVSELDAANLLASSRAELVNAADLATINQVIERENARLCPRRGMPASPWTDAGSNANAFRKRVGAFRT